MLLSFIAPLVMSVTIDSVLDGKPLNVPAYFSWYIEALGGPEAIAPKLWLMGLTTVVLTVLTGVCQFLRAKLNTTASEGAVKRLRDRLYAHIQRLPYAWHASAQTGDIIQRATNDVTQIQRFLNGTCLQFLRIVLLLTVGIFVMLSVNVTLALVSIGVVIPVALVSILFSRHLDKLMKDQENTEGKLFAVIQENLTGTRVVRAFGRQKFEMDKFNEENELNRSKLVKLNNYFALLWTMLDLLMCLEQTVVVALGVVLVVRGGLSVGQFTAFNAYVFLFFWPLREFGRVLNGLIHTLVAVGRVQEVLNEKPEDDLTTGKTPGNLSGDIVFSNVDFDYGDGKTVLKNLNLTIPGGKTAAFLGGTGSGKSTLALLLMRLYEPTSGSITIGGVPIREMSKQSLRSKLGIVLQEPFLYSKTLRENIGIREKAPELEAVRAAAAAASIDEDIADFAEGYETVVGERGVTLSGGQKQRVAIARALLGDPNVLIFDDSLSAVDTKTDAAIRRALKTRRENVTTMIISHRVTTLMEADVIFVLKDGAIAEYGSHDDLMTLGGGIYRKTYEIQSATAE
jgi:ATP-binding cassette subfamily B protein